MLQGEMAEEDKLGEIIDRCIDRAKPFDKNDIGYRKGLDEEGEVAYYEDCSLISSWRVREELGREIGNYLRIKEAEVNSRLTQAKCDAYELALTHTRPLERIREEQE